ncbi:Sec-independent protein translocase subunit TatA/TatB [Thermophagus sp. OGC60D27]|uniref:Sec-independent protein translocase subunit TatA/TatB n=1 Tax=Thermophagus sp. OGC60D27 TaxID=3458415 RepID=UPI00403787D3
MITFLFGISMGEIFVIFLVILLLFGADKIPEFARMLGKGMNEFRKAADDLKKEFEESTDDLKEDLGEVQHYLKEQKDEVNEDVKHVGEEVGESLREDGSMNDGGETTTEPTRSQEMDENVRKAYGLDEEKD